MFLFKRCIDAISWCDCQETQRVQGVFSSFHGNAAAQGVGMLVGQVDGLPLPWICCGFSQEGGQEDPPECLCL